jgi:hypothetical protein
MPGATLQQGAERGLEIMIEHPSKVGPWRLGYEPTVEMLLNPRRFRKTIRNILNKNRELARETTRTKAIRVISEIVKPSQSILPFPEEAPATRGRPPLPSDMKTRDQEAAATMTLAEWSKNRDVLKYPLGIFARFGSWENTYEHRDNRHDLSVRKAQAAKAHRMRKAPP